MIENKKITFWLRLMACCIFVGRAWQHLRWDTPLRSVLWSQKTMEPIVSGLFGVPWEQWVSSMRVDAFIQGTIRGMGVLFLVCAVAVWLVREKKWGQWLVGSGAAVLTLMWLLYFRRSHYQLGMFIEFATQIGVPWFLLHAVRNPTAPVPMTLFKVAIALTFIGHGLYAIGYHPTPGHFVTMLMNGLAINEGSARELLHLAGVLDMVVAVLIFVDKTDRPALAYAALWGFATASARVIAYIDLSDLSGWLAAWLHQTIYRLPHGGLPLLVLMLLRQKKAVASARPLAEGAPA